MTDGDGLDPAAVLAALGVRDATVVARVTGGVDAAIWRVQRGDTPFALRVFRPDQREVAGREVVAMTAAKHSGVPAPAVHAEGTWHDRPALLLAWCQGRTLLAEILARPWRTWALGVSFGRAQARIHRAPAPPGLPHYLDQPPRSWLDPTDQDDRPLQGLLRQLGAGSDALLHLDYHPLNVMVRGTRVSGILDWANGRAGDPRADLARTLTILRLAPNPPGAPPLLVTAARRVLELGWRHGYRQARGWPRNVAPFYAWAGVVMLRDLAPSAIRPRTNLTPTQTVAISHWTATWKRRAGLR